MAENATKTRTVKTTAARKKTRTRTEFLFVQMARDAELVPQRRRDTYTLTLRGLEWTIFFSDRPVRKAGHESNKQFVSSWTKGANSFAANPPNAELSLFNPGKAPSALTLTLTNPKWDKDAPHRISYTATLVGKGAKPIVDGPAALFIDGGKLHLSGTTCHTAREWTASKSIDFKTKIQGSWWSTADTMFPYLTPGGKTSSSKSGNYEVIWT